MKPSTVVSLFAGGGGLDRGLIRAGGIVERAYEWDAAACEVYPLVTGHGGIEQADLARFDLSKLPDAEGLIGGPPCQDFSTGGRQLGAEGKRNLWPVAIDAVRSKQPEWFLFENVRGLINPKHRPYFDSVLWQFRGLGYTVDWRLLNAADYGVPQTRERIFVVGWRDRRRYWNWPTPTHGRRSTMFEKQWVGVRDALATWIGGAKRPTTITPWLAQRYPEGVPDNVVFGHQQSWGGKCHRYLDEPFFTVDASHASFKIRIEGQVWMLDQRALAILQTLPPCVTRRRVIGNAVPPLLAERIFEAMNIQRATESLQ